MARRCGPGNRRCSVSCVARGTYLEGEHKEGILLDCSYCLVFRADVRVRDDEGETNGPKVQHTVVS